MAALLAEFSPQTLATAKNVFGTALGFMALDIAISKGPLRPAIYRAFNVNPAEKGGKTARRLASQLAAKLVGALFLTWVLPATFRALFDPDLSVNRLHSVTPGSQATMELAAAYFIYDIFLCVFKYSENGFEFLIHAVICCAVYVTAAFCGPFHYFAAGFLLWELSTPLLYLRWVLLKAGLAETGVMPLANAAFMLVFFGCRNVWGPILSYEFFQASGQELAAPSHPSGQPLLPHTALHIIRGACVTLNALNAWWFIQMVRIALGKQRKPKSKAV